MSFSIVVGVNGAGVGGRGHQVTVIKHNEFHQRCWLVTSLYADRNTSNYQP